ncbi:MAG: site-specific DNA-methyltransferase [Spirochaetes bacterium]|nr:MAG: site-specific DNA-methyltransferase [Spirochaetota bacterium]
MSTRKFDLSKVPEADRAGLLENLLTTQTSLFEQVVAKRPVSFRFLPDDPIKAVMTADHGGWRLPTNEFSPELSHLDGDGPLHRLFIGDNFHSLAGLCVSEAETFDLIYIDPPYNTGRKDMVYNDRFLTEEDGWRHSKWESFIEPRLRLGKNLLKRDGVIMVAIGHNEAARLRLILDDVFGENNFIDQITWTAGRKNDDHFVSSSVDYMFIYAKHMPSLKKKDKWRKVDDTAAEFFTAASEVWNGTSGIADVEERREEARQKFAAVIKERFRQSSDVLKGFNRFNENGRLYSSGGDLSFPGGNGYVYDVIHPVTNEVVSLPSRGYVCPEDTMRSWIDEGLIEFGKDHTTQPKKRRFEYSGTSLESVIAEPRTNANRHLRKILGASVFQHPKDHRILSEWFDVIGGKDANILDFFGGSGTTAEAVLMLNKKDGGSRRVTIVTDDYAEIGTKVARERIVRVMTGEGWHDGKHHHGYGGRLAVMRVGTQASISDTYIHSFNAWSRSAGRWAASTLPIDLHDDGAHTVVSDGYLNAIIAYGVPEGLSGLWADEDVVDDLMSKYSAERVYSASTLPSETHAGNPLVEPSHGIVCTLPLTQIKRVRQVVSEAVSTPLLFGASPFKTIQKAIDTHIANSKTSEGQTNGS